MTTLSKLILGGCALMVLLPVLMALKSPGIGRPRKPFPWEKGRR